VASPEDDSVIRFGTSGFRGRWDIEFTEPVARDIAQAVCDYMIEVDRRAGKVVVVGYDSREHADEVAAWCAGVALENGFAVHLTARDTPTPALAFYAGDILGDACAGVINCTSSHNPVEWQGIKFSLHDGSISPPRVTDFVSARATAYRRGERDRPHRAISDAERSRLETFDPMDEYCRWLLESGHGNCRILVDRDRIRRYFTGKRVIVDEMHGTGRGYLRRVLDEIGVDYRVIHGERDPRLGGLEAANPEEPHIQGLKDAVAESGAAIGLALDADADRYGIVDAGGIYIEPNYVLAMLTRHLGVERRLTGRVATTYVTTHVLERIARDIVGNESHRPAPGALPMHRRNPDYAVVRGPEEGIRSRNVFTVLTGLKYIVQVPQMDRDYNLLADPPADWRCRLLIGGEQASGLTAMGHVPDKDGMLACLLVLDTVSHLETSLSQLWEETQSLYGATITVPLNLTVPEAAKAPFIDSFLASGEAGRFAGMPVVFAGGIPGSYAELMLEDPSGSTDNYVHVRPSGTELLVRVYLEAASTTAIGALKDDVEARLRRVTS
jgi:phosphoglucomutase